MTHDRPILDQIPLDFLYRLQRYLTTHEIDNEENKRHAKRQNNDVMYNHYGSRTEQVLCMKAEILYYIHKQEKEQGIYTKEK